MNAPLRFAELASSPSPTVSLGVRSARGSSGAKRRSEPLDALADVRHRGLGEGALGAAVTAVCLDHPAISRMNLHDRGRFPETPGTGGGNSEEGTTSRAQALEAKILRHQPFTIDGQIAPSRSSAARRTRKSAQCLRLALGAGAHPAVLDEVRRQLLGRHPAVEPGALGDEHLGRSALAERPGGVSRRDRPPGREPRRARPGLQLAVGRRERASGALD